MPSLTSVPLTASGPVSGLSRPILTGSRAAWASTEPGTRTASRVRSVTKRFELMTGPPFERDTTRPGTRTSLDRASDPSNRMSSRRASDPEIPGLGGRIRAERVRRALVDDPALAQQVDVVGDAQREGQVLLDEQDRDALALEVGQHAAELADQQRRQPFRRLVHQDDVGI